MANGHMCWPCTLTIFVFLILRSSVSCIDDGISDINSSEIQDKYELPPGLSIRSVVIQKCVFADWLIYKHGIPAELSMKGLVTDVVRMKETNRCPVKTAVLTEYEACVDFQKGEENQEKVCFENIFLYF